jgi:hypothetical protein
MDTKQPLSLFLVAILAASVFTVVGLSSLPVQSATAQAATIETSADDHDGRFFGGMLQVIIEDEDTDDDGDSIDVEITAELDGGDEDTGTFEIQNTTDGSQRYELFLVHFVAGDQDPEDPDAAAANLNVITFGDGGDLDVAGWDLFDSGSIEIEYDGQTIVIEYDESTAELSVDRDAPYGSNSTVYLQVYDPDGNSDPTNRTNYVIPNADIADLLDISGAFVSGDLILNETSDNSAIFEAELQLNVTDNGLDNELVFEEEVISIEVTDKVNYADVDAVENTSTDTDEVTIEVDDEDGEADEIADLTFANGLQITIRDDDQNKDSEDEDVIEGALVVTVEAGDGSGDFVELDLRETDDNTGVFEIDLANDELRLQFLSDATALIWDTGAAGTGNDPGDDTILQVRQGDITEDILIEYNDPLPDDPADLGDPQVSITREIVITPGQLAAPEEVGVTDEFTVALTDNDLNTNSRIRDSYSFVLDGFGPWNLTRGANEYGEIYSLDMELNGDVVEFDTDVTVTMTETGINTGIFEFEIDLDDLPDNAEVDGVDVVLEDGDDLEISIDDNMDGGIADPEEDDVTVTIGRPDAGLDYSRTTVPLPPSDGTATSDFDHAGSRPGLGRYRVLPVRANLRGAAHQPVLDAGQPDLRRARCQAAVWIHRRRLHRRRGGGRQSVRILRAGDRQPATGTGQRNPARPVRAVGGRHHPPRWQRGLRRARERRGRERGRRRRSDSNAPPIEAPPDHRADDRNDVDRRGDHRPAAQHGGRGIQGTRRNGRDH